MFSQSGQLANAFIAEGAMLGLQFSKVVSYGNASDLQANDFLDYLGRDNKTEIIGAYIEGLRKGRDFFEKAGAITRQKPMVVVLERDRDPIRDHLTAALEERYREAGITVFPSFDLAARVLFNLYGYQAYLRNNPGTEDPALVASEKGLSRAAQME